MTTERTEQVSQTCRGIKRLFRLLNGSFNECKWYGTAEAFKQLGMDVHRDGRGRGSC